MSYFDDHHGAFGIVNRIENPVVTLTDSIPLMAGELFTARRPRVFRKTPHSHHQALAVLGSDGFQFLDRRRLDLESIACHDASDL